jgi:hypothetical protein
MKMSKRQEKPAWQGAFEHLLSDTKKRIEERNLREEELRRKERESIKRRFTKEYRILRKSNSILR